MKKLTAPKSKEVAIPLEVLAKVPDKVSFNLAQLCSYEDARKVATYLNTYGIGRGVKPGDDEHGDTLITNPNFPWLPPTVALPGIYVPSWLAGPGGFEVPHSEVDGKKLYWLHFRFHNGREGHNVGLIVDKFNRFPGNAAYVLNYLALEIGF